MRWMMWVGSWAWGLAVWAADPVLEYAYPAGGQPGSEFEVEVGGTALGDVTQAVVSGEGVTVTYLGPVRTMTRNQKGRPVVTVVPNRLRFKALVDTEASPGMRALRVSTAYRLSEPVGFEILAMPTLSEPASNRVAAAYDVAEIPVCLNGRIYGKRSDSYRFQARQGMSVVAFTEAQTLPPGAFVPALRFIDAEGNPCEEVTVYESTNAPVAVFEVPQDGTYVLEVKAASDTAGDACVYRVKLGELPLITEFSPVLAKEGESLNVRLEGVNLPQKRVRLFTGGKNSALCLQALSEGALALPSLRFELEAESAAPNFKVTMTPASLNIPADGSALVTLSVERFNGFKGEVRAGLEFPPLSIASEEGVIPAGQTTCQMTVSTDGVRYPRVVFGLALTATAEIDGQTVKRAVIPVRHYTVEGDDRTRVFDGVAARANTGLYALRLYVAPATPVIVPVQQPVRLTVLSSTLSTHLGGLYEPVVVYPPSGFSVQGTQRTNKQERAAVLLQADPHVFQPGATGQVILGCVYKGNSQRTLMAVTQSVPFVIK